VLGTHYLPSALRRIKSQFQIFLTAPFVAEMIVIAALLAMGAVR
jgi:hypothetical protein